MRSIPTTEVSLEFSYFFRSHKRGMFYATSPVPNSSGWLILGESNIAETETEVEVEVEVEQIVPQSRAGLAQRVLKS